MATVPAAGFWRGRRVLVTGHTGFVGGWLASWLARLDARVTGLALEPPTVPSFFALARLESSLESHVLGDVTDAALVERVVRACDPQVVFHLAAQPLVREAYREPRATFATNVMGTVNLLEACRNAGALERIVVYTTDKVYRNDESGRAFVETDRLGGNEPYSASKAAADYAASTWWNTYLRRAARGPSLAIVRGGNIVGGGDWARERIVADAIRAFEAGAPLVVRNPASTRPWQHVLDVVRGTLLLAERDARGEDSREDPAWNFGPDPAAVRSVRDLAEAMVAAWGAGAAWRHEADGSIPESRALVLSSAKAARLLGWRCAWSFEETIARTVEWYRAAQKGADVASLTQGQIDRHLADAERAR